MVPRALLDATNVGATLAASVQARYPFARELATESEVVENRLLILSFYWSRGDGVSSDLLPSSASLPALRAENTDDS